MLSDFLIDLNFCTKNYIEHQQSKIEITNKFD